MLLCIIENDAIAKMTISMKGVGKNITGKEITIEQQENMQISSINRKLKFRAFEGGI